MNAKQPTLDAYLAQTAILKAAASRADGDSNHCRSPCAAARRRKAPRHKGFRGIRTIRKLNNENT